MAESAEASAPIQSVTVEIRDFVFDLHELTRISFRSDDLIQLYDLKFKELTEKYFPQSQWPHSRSVSPECNSDDKFLLFYRYEESITYFTTIIFNCIVASVYQRQLNSQYHMTNSVIFYCSVIREMTVRHLFTKLKPQLSDFLESWSNYNKVISEFTL
jgi:hypothetical protein